MSVRRRLLPSTSALAAFEAVARTKSFTNSAADLGLTQLLRCRDLRARYEPEQLPQRAKAAALLDHLVGAGEQGGRDGEAEVSLRPGTSFSRSMASRNGSSAASIHPSKAVIVSLLWVLASRLSAL
jgi:hypothetical protein